MAKLAWASLPLLLMIVLVATVHGADQESGCAPALQPTQEALSSDSSKMQAYMFYSAGSEYERLFNMTAEARSAQATYKAYSGEYADSRSSQQFSEKVQKRLRIEGFQMNEREALSYTRQYVTDAQVAGWTTCILAKIGGGALLLRPRNPVPTGFTLKVTWVPQKSVGTANLTLKVTDGTIDGKTTVSEQLTGFGDQSFFVSRRLKAPVTTVLGNIAGSTDDIAVNFNAPPPVALALDTMPIADALVGTWTGKWIKDGETDGPLVFLAAFVREHRLVVEQVNIDAKDRQFEQVAEPQFSGKELRYVQAGQGGSLVRLKLQTPTRLVGYAYPAVPASPGSDGTTFAPNWVYRLDLLRTP